MTWNELSSASLEAIIDWAASQPWARAMAACQQDAVWHSEGDVWTHTQLVCAQLPQLREWPDLSPREQLILIFTALLHDAGKPLTSRIDPESGRLTSPRHAVEGEHLARAVLREAGCDLQTREEIARMVRYHGRPAFLLSKPDPAREVVSLSWHVNNRLLYLFALADSRGRDALESSRPEENLEFWRLAAEENGCFDRSFPFGNDQARFLFYHSAEPNLHYVPHEEYRSRVTLLAGLPGSGKDTWLASNIPEIPVVSLDGIRAELKIAPTDNQGQVIQSARNRCREFLRAGSPFAFNATNLLVQTRQRWIDLFADYGARIEIVYVEPPMERIFEQNRRRHEPVPEKVIRELAEKCEPPTWAEGHSLIFAG